MKLSSQIKMNFSKVIPITILFILFNIFLTFFNKAILSSTYSLGPSPLFDFNIHLKINVLVGLFAGIFGGSLLVLVNSKVFRRKSFRFTLLTLFLLQVNDKFGPGILLKFIRGKYHHPRIEQRIFMFLDMRSSTTIAEKIGNEKYFNLLNDMFSDITDTILKSRGEIYQYVGDEIVISWPLIKGIQSGKFIHCFFEIQKKLIDLGTIYIAKYGVIPELKAGIHDGQGNF